jgi:hypothetical protein
MLFAENLFNFWEKYHISGKIFGMSGKFFWDEQTPTFPGKNF